ncbi:MAG TPA: hypothetical protein QGF95_16580 [Candidatus Latescibacteria bacterium]|nr:hypothetical protein [Candidatus Latescibacterota bacterium]HJP32163.1 hypothetical protein [Candidatus Latescibacterota bacterium]
MSRCDLATSTHLRSGGSVRHALVAAICLVMITVAQAPAQRLIVEDRTPPAGVFATFGVGVIDVEEGTGLDVPFGITAISPAHRVMATINLFDFGLLQGADSNPRYQRFYDTRFGQELCVDTTTSPAQLVPFGRCAGDTNVLRSLTMDIDVLPVETVIVGSKPGSLHAGMGWRLDDPSTVYGTIGMFFPSHSGKAAGVRLSMGRRYIFLGFSWGINVRRAMALF